DGIDFEALNAMVKIRQPLIQWTIAPRETLRITASFENTDTQLTGATAVGQWPDLVGRVQWQRPHGGHLRSAVMWRQVRGAPSSTPADIVGGSGWGVNGSGRLA